MAAAPKGFSFSFRPLISKFPPGAAKVPTVLPAPKPPNPPPDDPPNELPPKVEDPEPPSAPNPPPVDVVGAALPAKEANLLPLAAPNGELVLGLGLASPPNGDEAEAAKPPKPEALNLSSEVCGSDSGLSEVFGSWGLAAMAAKGDDAEKLANPLPGGIWSKC